MNEQMLREALLREVADRECDLKSAQNLAAKFRSAPDYASVTIAMARLDEARDCLRLVCLVLDLK